MGLPKLRTNSRDTKDKGIMFRATKLEQAVLKEKADKFTGGNISDFLRHAIMRWEPELTKEEQLHEDRINRLLESD